MNKAELQKSTENYSIATVGNLASFEGKAFEKDIPKIRNYHPIHD